MVGTYRLIAILSVLSGRSRGLESMWWYRVLGGNVGAGGSVMGDRSDELKGQVKKGFGHLAGNVGLEAEGNVQAGVARVRRKTRGALREAGGTLQEGLGNGLHTVRAIC